MVVELKIKKQNPWVGLVKYRHCFDYIAPYWTRSGARYTGLTPEDEKRFEKELGYPEGTLARTSDFWVTYSVRVGSRTVILDDKYPSQALMIKFLSKHKRVATTLEQKNDPSKDYIMINKQEAAIQANKANKTRRDALKEFDKLSIDQMRKCLRIYGVSANGMSNELVESTLFNLVDKNPSKFFDLWVNNKQKETQYLIEEAISKGIIRRDKTQYYYGTELMATSLNDCIDYLDAKKNQDLKLAIITQVENK